MLKWLEGELVQILISVLKRVTTKQDINDLGVLLLTKLAELLQDEIAAAKAAQKGTTK